MDAARRVSVSEVTTSLESAVLNDDRNHPSKKTQQKYIFDVHTHTHTQISAFRQAALLTFKGEITQLRNQLHQVS